MACACFNRVTTPAVGLPLGAFFFISGSHIGGDLGAAEGIFKWGGGGGGGKSMNI